MKLRAIALALVALAACVKNPVTGKRQFSLVSTKDEIAMGQQGAKEISATMGEYPDPKVKAYVEGVGKQMAARSERPELPWTFTVIDDPTVNAFALPGGPVFVTRGILTHLNSEAELAAVLGHEIGHITARHSAQQISKAQLAQLGLGVGMILRPDLQGVGQLAGVGLQLMFLKYGRDAERQADDLGFRYMGEQGYDVHEMANVFTTLERASQSAGAGRIPEWLSTHPNPGNRAEKARERASKVQTDPAKLKVERERYLANLGGMVFGENPRQGFFKGSTFMHPDLRFQITFPQGWKTQNTSTAVVAVSPKDDAAMQLSVAGKVTPEEATRKFFAQEGVRAAEAASGTVGGLPATAAYFEAKTQQGVVRGLVSFVAHGGETFQVLGYTGAQSLPAYDPAFKAAIGSFGTLNDPAALAVQPAKVELVRVPREMTVDEFAREFPSTATPDVLAIINGVPKDGRLQAGQTAKRVVGGVPAPAVSPPAR